MIDIKKIQKCVLASMAVESDEGKKTTENYLKGKITSEEAIKRIKIRWGVKVK